MQIKTFGSVDDRSLEQLTRCMEAARRVGVLSPTITRATRSRSAAASPASRPRASLRLGCGITPA